MTLRYLSLFSLWLGPIISFYIAYLRQSSYLFSLTWAMVQAFFCSVASPPLFTVWAWPSLIDTSQTLPLVLIGCIDPGAVDLCKSNYSLWVDPQTVGFYTADLHFILLSDHNDNFNKYNQKIVTDSNFKRANGKICRWISINSAEMLKLSNIHTDDTFSFRPGTEVTWAIFL